METKRVQQKSPHLFRNISLLILASAAIGAISFFVIMWLFTIYLQYASKTLDWGLLGGFASVISRKSTSTSGRTQT